MTDILTKKQNYALWQSGAFGNKLRAWRTITEWRLAGGHTDLRNVKVALRVLLPDGGGGPCRYNLLPHEVDNLAFLWMNRGVMWENIMVNEMGPDDAILLQGEYLNDIHVLGSQWGYFLHSWICKPMRLALAEKSEIAQGLRSDLILRSAMTPSSYDDWQMLLEQYPGHVFEVSIYDRCLGDIPNRNALVWEVRKY